MCSVNCAVYCVLCSEDKKIFTTSSYNNRLMLKADFECNFQRLKLSEKVIFVLVLTKFLNIDICVAK